MRRTIKFGVGLLALMAFVSCNEKANVQKVHKHKIGEAYHLVYQCPMKCKKTEYYNDAGKCPVCKINLIKIEHEKK